MIVVDDLQMAELDNKIIGRFTLITSELEVRMGLKIENNKIQLIPPKGVKIRTGADFRILRELKNEVEFLNAL